ncbi:glycosyltransferase [Desulfothermobacter acidiphilus]|uniref:glycosyltransferase n=1 Tax=Desulfothermobacter acidiphilus TaxID=1938353 RepID=UPI003F8A7CE7
MTRHWSGFGTKVFLNPPPSGRQALLRGKAWCLSWTFQRCEEIWVATPPLGFIPLSASWGRFKLAYSLRTLAFSLRRLLGANWEQRVVLYLPSGAAFWGAKVARLFRPRTLVLEVLDDNLSFPGQQGRALEDAFAFLLSRATLVTAVSQVLVEKLQELFGVTACYLPNGVEVGKFAPDPAYAEPWPELASCSRPRLGFVGTLTDWIDYSLLLELAHRLEEGSVVLAGPVVPEVMRTDQWQALKRHPRVFWLGPVPYNRVPHLLHQLDLLLLPRNYLPHSLACDPLKLYEYMATGKPVLTTDLPTARRFDNLIYVAREQEEFIALAQRVWRHWTPERAMALRREAAEFSWERRAERLQAYLLRCTAGNSNS